MAKGELGKCPKCEAPVDASTEVCVCSNTDFRFTYEVDDSAEPAIQCPICQGKGTQYKAGVTRFRLFKNVDRCSKCHGRGYVSPRVKMTIDCRSGVVVDRNVVYS